MTEEGIMTIDQAERRMRGILIYYTASFFVWGGALTLFFAIMPIGPGASGEPPARETIIGVLAVMLAAWAV